MTGRWPALAGHLEKIPYFVTVARVGTLQAAARELRLAQPSLTKSMQLLEGALGAQLFTRGRRGVTLTAAGEEFRKFCEPLLASLASTERSVRAAAGDIGVGEMRIGTHEILMREFWPALVREIESDAPRLKLKLLTAASVGELQRRLAAAELDIVVAVECERTADVALTEIRSDRYGVFASKAFCRKHQLSARSRLDQAELARLPLIYAAETIAGPRLLLEAALRATGFDRASDYAVRSLESVQSLIEGSLGLGLLPRRMVLADKHSRLVELASPALGNGHLGEHKLYAATSKGAQRDPLTQDVLRRVVRLLSS